MKLGVLFSGGKDSLLALVKAKEAGHDISCLISMISSNEASYMFHVPNISITKLQSEALSIPLIQEKTRGEKEAELADLRNAIVRAKNEYGITGVVTGAIRSVYQASRVERICKELDLWCFNPLWLMDQEVLLKEVLSRGFKIVISGIFAYPLTKEFLGSIIDDALIKKLVEFGVKYHMNPAGEGGEIETTVIDAPFFNKRIEIIDSEVLYLNHSGNFFIKKAGLVAK